MDRGKIKRNLDKRIDQRAGEWLDRQVVRLGKDDTQLIETGKPGVLWARLSNGRPIKVRTNTTNVPSQFDLHLVVGRRRSQPNIWQVIYTLEDYDEPAGGGELTYHHKQHEEEGPDRLVLSRKQINARTVRVKDSAGFIVRVYGDTDLTASGWKLIPTKDFNLSSYVPSAGALFVAIESDNDGALSINPGTGFAAPGIGSPANYPVPDSGKYPIARVLLYEGQTALLDKHITISMPPSYNPFGAGSAVAWGDITGTLSDQTDLQAALDTKLEDAPVDGEIYGRMDGAWEAVPVPDAERYLAVYNTYLGAGSIAYRLGLATSPDSRTWTIQDDTLIDLGTAGQWDSYNHQFPKLLSVNGVLHLYFAGKDGSGWSNFKIGLARSFDGGATWEKYASNPVITNAVAWENTNVFKPVVLYDLQETDSSKRWKMWYAGSSFGEGIGYAYSADGLSWTKFASNPVMTLGTGWEDTYIIPHAIIRRGDTYILFYGGKTGAAWKCGYVTFTDPEGTYTRYSGNPILSGDQITTTLTANLTSGSTTATVADATVFPIGCPVWIGGATRFLTHVIKRNSSTSIELADAAPTTISSGQNVRSVAYGSLDMTGVEYDGGYRFTVVAHQPDGLTEAGVHEVTMRAFALPTLERAYLDYGAGLQIPVTLAESQNTNVSRENSTVLDTWEEEERRKPIEPSADTGIEEAPIDGSLYGRKDGAWEEVVAGSGGFRAIIMATGITDPPVPVQNAEGTDWIYSTD